MAASWLREEGVDERIVNGVLAHAYERYRTDLMSRAVVHADAVPACSSHPRWSVPRRRTA